MTQNRAWDPSLLYFLVRIDFDFEVFLCLTRAKKIFVLISLAFDEFKLTDCLPLNLLYLIIFGVRLL